MRASAAATAPTCRKQAPHHAFWRRFPRSCCWTSAPHAAIPRELSAKVRCRRIIPTKTRTSVRSMDSLDQARATYIAGRPTTRSATSQSFLRREERSFRCRKPSLSSQADVLDFVPGSACATPNTAKDWCTNARATEKTPRLRYNFLGSASKSWSRNTPNWRRRKPFNGPNEGLQASNLRLWSVKSATFRIQDHESKITKERGIHGKYQKHHRQNRAQESEACSTKKGCTKGCPDSCPGVGQAQSQEDGTRPVEAVILAFGSRYSKGSGSSVDWGLFNFLGLAGAGFSVRRGGVCRGMGRGWPSSCGIRIAVVEVHE